MQVMSRFAIRNRLLPLGVIASDIIWLNRFLEKYTTLCMI